MESNSINTSTNSKFNLNARTPDCSQSKCDKQKYLSTVVSSSYDYQKSSNNPNRKRPNSFPFASKIDNHTSTERTKMVSQLKSKSELSVTKSEKTENLYINSRTQNDSSRNVILPLPDEATKKNNNSKHFQPKVFSETIFCSLESIVDSEIKENLPISSVNGNVKLLATQNSGGTTLEEDSGIKCQVLPPESKKCVRPLAHDYEKNDEIDSKDTIKSSKSNTSIIKNNISKYFQSDVFSKTILPPCELVGNLGVEESLPAVSVNGNVKLLATQNSITTVLEEDSDIESECQILPPESKRHLRTLVHDYTKIVEIDNKYTAKSTKYNVSSVNINLNEELKKKFEEKKNFFAKNEELVSPVNQKYHGSQVKLNSSDYEEPKVPKVERNVEKDEDEMSRSHLYYPKPPPLPLKQKSKSCMSLFQALKGISKRKSNDQSRHSSPGSHSQRYLFPDNALTQRKQRSASTANVSETSDRGREFPHLPDPIIRNVIDPGCYEIPGEILPDHPNFAWFHPIDAREATRRLTKMGLDGAFLVRPASKPINEMLHTLCVMFSNHVYNFHIQTLRDGSITLGKRLGQLQTFESLEDMIKYHRCFPLPLHITETNQVAFVSLYFTPQKD